MDYALYVLSFGFCPFTTLYRNIFAIAHIFILINDGGRLVVIILHTGGKMSDVMSDMKPKSISFYDDIPATRRGRSTFLLLPTLNFSPSAVPYNYQGRVAFTLLEQGIF